MSEPRSGEIVIEIDEHREVVSKEYGMPDAHGNISEFVTKVVSGNGAFYFYPIEDALRSRMYFSRTGSQYGYVLDRAFNQIEFIPGQRIHIDMRNNIGRITDALGDPEHKGLIGQLQLAASNARLPFQIKPPAPDQEFKFRSASEAWTWAFWMRRVVDMGCALEGPRQCRPVQNVHNLPDADKILGTRKVRLPIYRPEVMTDLTEQQKKDPNFKPGDHGVLTPDMFPKKTEGEAAFAGMMADLNQ